MSPEFIAHIRKTASERAAEVAFERYFQPAKQASSIADEVLRQKAASLEESDPLFKQMAALAGEGALTMYEKIQSCHNTEER